MKSRYVIVGNGVAGMTAAEAIRALDPAGSIVVLAEENEPFYYRVRLPEVVAGSLAPEGLRVKKDSWYRDKGVEVRLGTRAVSGDPERRTVRTETGEEFGYDRLLLAPGSRSFVPPLDGSSRPGVFTLRTLADALALKAHSDSLPPDRRRAVLIGGGLLGLEAGNGLRRLGFPVTVVEIFPRLLPRQLDFPGAAVLQEILEELGFTFRLGVKTRAIAGAGAEGAVENVVLDGGDGGEALPAGLVLVSAGVRPELGLAKALGVAVGRGVLVDQHLRTSREDIFAAGDVAEAEGTLYGVWTAAMEQGRVAGTNMAGGDVTYRGTAVAHTLKVAGVSVASSGDIDAENVQDTRSRRDGRTYRKLVLAPGEGGPRLTGCIMVGRTNGFFALSRLMAEGKPLPVPPEALLDPAWDGHLP